MARINNLNNFLTDVADAIRAKTGGTAPIDAEDFDTEIANIETGGNVKLFETTQAMQADEDPHEGDLAVVYSQNVSNITEDTEFSTCTFPASVTLPYEVTEEVHGSFIAVDASEMFDGFANLSAESFIFNGYYESSSIRVQYTSSDGIHYTRTDTGEEIIDFGVTVKFDNRYEEFDTNYGYFMRAKVYNFGGLFEYTLDHVNEDIIVPASGFTYSNGTISPINTNLQININNINVFTTAISACEEYAGVSLASNTGMIFCNDDISHIYVYTVNNFSSSTSSLCFDSNNTLYFRLSGNGTINGYDYDVDLGTVTSISLTQTPIQRY